MNLSTLQTVLKLWWNRRYVPPVTEYQIGRQLYRTGHDITDCLTDDSAKGWLAAEQAGMMAYYGVMMAEAANR